MNMRWQAAGANPRTVRWVLIATTVAILEIATRTTIIDPLTLSPPSDIVVELGAQLGNSEFYSDVTRTGSTVLIAICIAVVIGVGLGTLCWRFAIIGDVLEPYLAALFAMPTLIFYPILLSVMGLTMWPVVTIATTMVIVPVALNTMVGFRSIDPVLLRMGQSMNCGPWQMFKKILLPAAMPLLVAGLRLGCIYAIIGTIAMEFILADSGLGYRVSVDYKNFLILNMWANVVAIAIFALVLTSLLGLLQRRVRKEVV